MITPALLTHCGSGTLRVSNGPHRIGKRTYTPHQMGCGLKKGANLEAIVVKYKIPKIPLKKKYIYIYIYIYIHY